MTRDISDLMAVTLGETRLRKGIERARALLLWSQAVGVDLAKLTRARSLKETTLYIEVSDSSIAHHLSMQRHHLLKKLNEVMGDRSVTELRFVVGTVTAPEPKKPKLPPLPPADYMRAQALAANASPRLYEVALQAAETLTRVQRWREQQGWLPCPVCGTLCEPTQSSSAAPEPCLACRQSLKDVFVKRAAGILVRFPERLPSFADSLGYAGTDAAVYLALDELERQLKKLAIEVLSNKEYAAFFHELGKVYLSLRLRKDRSAVVLGDHVHLPHGVAQVWAAGF